MAVLPSDFEQLILTALLTANSPQYGTTVYTRVNSLAQGLRPVSPSAIYTTLERLEQKKYIRSWNGGITGKRGGRSKRYYAATATGRQALQKALIVSANILDALKANTLKQHNQVNNHKLKGQPNAKRTLHPPLTPRITD